MNQGGGDDDVGMVGCSVTDILLLSFLQNSSNCAFLSELQALEIQLAPSKFLSDDLDDGELQIDGNRFGRPQSRNLVALEDEELFRIIGARLAVIGDRIAAEIEPSLIQNLVQNFAARNVSKEEITRHLSEVVQMLLRKAPLEMEREKAMLLLAMALAKNVANAMPSLLRPMYFATVNYINYNLRDYVNNLRPEAEGDGSLHAAQGETFF